MDFTRPCSCTFSRRSNNLANLLPRLLSLLSWAHLLGMRCVSLVFCHATTSSTRRTTSGCGEPLPEALPAWDAMCCVQKAGQRAGNISSVSWQYVEPKRVQVYIYLPYTQRAHVYIYLYRSVKTHRIQRRKQESTIYHQASP